MTDYAALIERLELAEGPDRKLDRAIAIKFGWRDMGAAWAMPGETHGSVLTFPAYTGPGIDAALAQVPGYARFLKIEQRTESWFAGFEVDRSPFYFGGIAKTASNALLIAIFRARQHMETKHE